MLISPYVTEGEWFIPTTPHPSFSDHFYVLPGGIFSNPHYLFYTLPFPRRPHVIPSPLNCLKHNKASIPLVSKAVHHRLSAGADFFDSACAFSIFLPPPPSMNCLYPEDPPPEPSSPLPFFLLPLRIRPQSVILSRFLSLPPPVLSGIHPYTPPPTS